MTTTTRRWLHLRDLPWSNGHPSQVCRLVDDLGRALCGVEADVSFWEPGEGWRACSVCVKREGN